MNTKALRPENSISGTAKSAGIPKATLYTWIQRARMGSMSKDSIKKRRGRARKSSRWSAEEKLRILTEASGLAA
ncbi:MAG: hypothetical protein GY811_20745 [Myxococcales bacterium]|nr:hypothetical protein [Myxococcales bacterium]